MKMSLYAEFPASSRRRGSQTVLYLLLSILNKALAPLVPHVAEEIHTHWNHNLKKESVFMSGWLEMESEWDNALLADEFQSVILVRDEVNKLLEVMRKEKGIRRPEEAELDIYFPKSSSLSELSIAISNVMQDEETLSEILQVSAVRLHSEDATAALPSTSTAQQQQQQWTSQPELFFKEKPYLIKIVGKAATMHKCPRCWRHNSQQQDGPCPSCTSVLAQLGK